MGQYVGMSAAEADIYNEIDQAIMEGRPADAEMLRSKLKQLSNARQKKNKFEIGGHTYTHIKGTHTFKKDDAGKPLTLEQVLQLIYPKQYKSLKLKPLSVPLMFTDMSPACRRRAMKMIEYHYYPNLTLPDIDEALALVECAQSAVVSEKSAFFSTFFAAQHATNYDAAKALALCVYFGNTTLDAARTDRVALYKLHADDKGMHLEIAYPHTMEDRVNHAQAVMAVMANYNLSMGFPIKVSTLVNRGFQLISSYNGYNISYTKEFFMEISQLLSSYARQLAQGDFYAESTLRYPYQLIEPEERFLAWDKLFVLDNYLLSTNGKKLIEIYQKRFANYERFIPIKKFHLRNFVRPNQVEACIEHRLLRMADDNHFILLWPLKPLEGRKFEDVLTRKTDKKKMWANKIIY